MTIGRDGTRGCGCGFGENPPAGKPAGLEKTRREQTCGYIFAPTPAPADFGRVSGARGSNNRYNKMYKFINLNSQITHFYK